MVFYALGSAAWAADDIAQRKIEAQQKLATIRTELERLQISQQRLQDNANTAIAAVREVDRSVQAQMTLLRKLQADAEKQKARWAELEQQRSVIAQNLVKQRAVMAARLRSIHRLGHLQQWRLWLAQDDFSSAARVLDYYHYFQRDQLQRVRRLLSDLASLAQISAAAQTQRDIVTASVSGVEGALADLNTERARRAKSVAQIQRQQRNNTTRLGALQRDEQALQALIEALSDVFVDIPEQLDGTQSIALLKGQLPMPTSGRVTTEFAEILPDGRPSEGWWIKAKAGAPVRAIAHGRVAFSEWMKGYGLLLILDHGEGYMSLYAFNDGLLREAGDWVNVGEPIAEAGNSGGQLTSGLYFELRHHGKPLDPKAWLLLK